jgi:hypothetical protein
VKTDYNNYARALNLGGSPSSLHTIDSHLKEVGGRGIIVQYALKELLHNG